MDNWFGRKLDELFGIDTRTLALFRVGLALLFLADVALRALYLEAHYADAGVLPRGVYLSKFVNFHAISLHLMAGTVWFQALIFCIAAAAGFALLFGYRTTLANVVCWFLLISMHSRNPDILDGGDVLFRVLLFWGIFLPLGAHWSVDRARTPSPPPSRRVLSGGSVALLLQMACMYFFAALFKTGVEWHNGTAVHYALHLDHFSTPLAKWLLQYPDLLKMLTHLTLQFEFYGPILLFLPFSVGLTRGVLILLLFGMHLGFGLCLHLGLFVPIAWCGLLSFLPSSFWDALERRLCEPRPAVCLYLDDRVPGLLAWGRLLKTFLLLSHARIVARSEEPSLFATTTKGERWGVTDAQGNAHVSADAWPVVFEASALLFWPMRWRPLRSLAILCIAALAGPPGSQALDADASSDAFEATEPASPSAALLMHPGWLRGTLAGVLAAYVLMWNVHTVKPLKQLHPGWWDMIHTLRLDQGWDLFAPYPMKEDGWFILEATLVSGQKVDLFRQGKPLSWKKPSYVASLYAGQRWRKYYLNLWSRSHANRRPLFARYLCRTWNRRRQGEKRVKKLNILYMLERTPPPGAPPPRVQKLRLWQQWCLPRQKIYHPKKR